MRPGKGDVHLLTLRLGNLCGAPAGAPGDSRGTTDTAKVTCLACFNAGLRALVRDMLGVMGPGPVAAGFAAAAGKLGVTGADGRPLTDGYGDGYPDSERDADALAYQRNGDDERDGQ